MSTNGKVESFAAKLKRRGGSLYHLRFKPPTDLIYSTIYQIMDVVKDVTLTTSEL